MSKKRKAATPSQEAPPPPTIHEAELGSGGTGTVDYGEEIDLASAVVR